MKTYTLNRAGIALLSQFLAERAKHPVNVLERIRGWIDDAETSANAGDVPAIVEMSGFFTASGNAETKTLPLDECFDAEEFEDD